MSFPPSGGLYMPRLKRRRRGFRTTFGGDKEGSVRTSQSDNKTSTATGSNGVALLDCKAGNKKRRERAMHSEAEGAGL